MGKQRVGKTDEQIEDIVNALVSGSDNVTASYDDGNDTLTLSLADQVSASTLEADSVTFNQDITDADNNTVTSLSDPVRVTEEASTFTESDITLTTTAVSVSSGSLALNDVSTGTTAVRPDDNQESPDYTNKRGIVINPNNNLAGIKLQISSNTGGTGTVELVESGSVIKTKDLSGLNSGDSFNIDVSLSSGTDYTLKYFDSSDGVDMGEFDSASYNYSSTDIDIVAGFNNGLETQSSAYAFKSVTAIDNFSNKSGNALIEFDSGVPSDIDSWDLATFQRTLDNETVTIDVEDSNGTVLKSDISKDTDISDIATSTDVQLRANLSRNDTENNPTVDYLARRFTR